MVAAFTTATAKCMHTELADLCATSTLVRLTEGIPKRSGVAMRIELSKRLPVDVVELSQASLVEVNADSMHARRC